MGVLVGGFVVSLILGAEQLNLEIDLCDDQTSGRYVLDDENREKVCARFR